MPYKETFFGKKLKRIRSAATDVYVRHYVVYVNADGTACVDPEGTVPVGSELLMDLYKKGLLISDNGVLYTPVSVSQGEPTVSVSYIKSLQGGPVLAVTTSSEECPYDPVLTALSVVGKTLTPLFSSDVMAYAVTTADASNLITFTPLSEDAVVSMTLNSVAVTDMGAPLAWVEGTNTVIITLELEADIIVYTITVTKISAPVLTSLSVGGKTLTPEFSSGVTEYAASTSDASDLVTLAALPANSVVVVTLNDAPVEDLATPLTWIVGENVVKITLTSNGLETVYTITVTAE